MDVEWCIMCDNKIYPTDQSETYSAYCSTHCFLTAHLEASQSQNQSTTQTQSTSQTQTQSTSSNKPESKKKTNSFSNHSSNQQYTIKQNYPINSTSSSSSSSNLNRNGNLRIDSIYPIHSLNSIGLEESISNQFLSKPSTIHQNQNQNSSQYILSSVYSSISTTNDQDLLNLNLNHYDHDDNEIVSRGRSLDRKGLNLGIRYQQVERKIWLGLSS